MSRPIDEKIVAMKMDNSDFKRKVVDTLKSFQSMNRGLSDAANVDLSNVAKGISSIENKFSATSVVIGTIINRLTNKAMDLGQKLLGAIVDPLVEGGKKRALNIEQAQFQFEGLGMDVEASMASALEAVKGTAFGLDEAAVVAAQFGASGMKAGDEMTAALRGISGVAAMAGSSYSDIGNVFTKVAGQGRVMGDDLLRLSARGINAAATIGQALNKTEAEVREMVTKGQIDFNTFASAMNDAFGEHATKANETYTGSLSNLNAAFARIGASLAAPDFTNKRDIFNALTPKVDQLADALGPLIEVWNEFQRAKTDKIIAFIDAIDLTKFIELGGAENIAKAFFNVMSAGSRIMGAFGKGLKALIPSTGNFSETLVKITEVIVKFTEGFTLSASAVEKLSTVFQGIFSIFSTVGILIKELGSALLNLVPSFKKASGEGGGGGALGFLESLAQLAIAFNESVRNGNILTEMIQGLGVILSHGGRALGAFGDMLHEIWSILARGDFIGVGPWDEDSKIVSWLFNIREAFQSLFEWMGTISLSNIGAGIVDFFTFVIDGLKTIGNAISTAWNSVVNAMPEGDTILTGGFIASLLAITGMVVKMGLDFMKAFKGWLDIGGGLNGVLGGVTDFLDSAGKALNAFSLEVKSKALINVAIAIGILTLSFWGLSKLDTAQITNGIIMIMGAMTAIVGAMAVMSKYDIEGGSLRTSFQIIAMAGAVALLSVAVKGMAGMNFGEMAQGLLGVTVMLGGLAGAMALMSKFNSAGIATTSLQIVAFAGAMALMIIPLKQMANMETDALQQGLLGMAALLGMVAVAVTVMSVTGNKVGASSLQFLAIAGSLMIMVEAIKMIAKVPVEDLKVGLSTIGALLLAIGAFTLLTDNAGLLSTGAGLILLAAGLTVLVIPVKQLGEMDPATLGQGLLAMALGLTAIGLASKLMTGMVVAGVGVALLAVAVTMLVPPILMLGNIEWTIIAAGITAMALAIGVIGGAAALLGLAGPALLIGAAGIAALGIAMLAAGAGMSLFATGLVTLATMTAGAITAIVATLSTLIMGLTSLIPLAIDFVVDVILQISEAITENSPILAENFMTMIFNILEVLEENLPQIYDKFYDMIMGIILVVQERAPEVATAFLGILEAVMIAVGEKSGELIELGGNIVIDLMTGIAEKSLEVRTTAMDLMIEFVEGLTAAVRENGPRLTDAVLELMGTVLLVVVDAGIQTVNALFGWIPGVKEATTEIGKTAEKYIDDNFGAESLGRDKGTDFSTSLSGTQGDAGTAAELVAGAAKNGLDVDTSILGSNFGSGFASGIESQSVLSKVAGAAKRIAIRAKNAVEDWLDIGSPSRVMRKDGGWFGEGFALGIVDKAKRVGDSAKQLAITAMDSLNQFLDGFELPEDDNELHFKAVIDYDEVDYDGIDPSRFQIDSSRFGTFGLTPDTSMSRGLISEIIAGYRQNENISPRDESKEESREEDSNQDKQPAIIQIVTPDKREFARWVVDDVTEFQTLRTNTIKQF